MLKFADVGKPVGPSERLRLPVVAGRNPELGPATVGRRVVELTEFVGARLGAENVVILRVDAIVGRVPDDAKVLDKESDELELRIEGKTMLGPVPIGAVTEGAVVRGGVGITEMVDRTETVPGLPCRVRVWVVVPVVT